MSPCSKFKVRLLSHHCTHQATKYGKFYVEHNIETESEKREFTADAAETGSASFFVNHNIPPTRGKQNDTIFKTVDRSWLGPFGLSKLLILANFSERRERVRSVRYFDR